jgi:hypothetical protein
MRMPKILAGAAILGALLAAGPTAAQQVPADCAVQTAPGRFQLRAATPANPGSEGIVPTGFVAPEGMAVLHGIDASKWQRSVDFVRVKTCGGSFAYIRLTAGRRPDLELEYRSHWSAARAAGVTPGPYHALTLIDPPTPWSQLTAAQQAANLAANLAAAEEQAKLFTERLREVLLLEQRSRNTLATSLGGPYLPIMLAVTQRPQVNAPAADRQAIAEVYRRTICRFYEVVEADPGFRGQTMGFFSTPFIYNEYRLGSACGMAERMAWIGHHSRNGDSEQREPDPSLRAGIRSMCLKPDGANRCLFQQYTAWGGFASYSETEGLDLNRFYGERDAFERILQLGRR